MPVTITWQAIALRLILTLIAGALLGIDRSRHGHPAGLRTTLLVTLAASVAMIQMNLLLPTNGKPHDSYAVMDLMRLPLGILTGVGFIGAGAIVRRDDLVIGVTTAATMWFATVVGLCMGGGQLILGSVSALIGVFVLWNLKRFEERMNHTEHASLVIRASIGAWTESELRAVLAAAGIHIKTLSIIVKTKPDPEQTWDCEVSWRPENSAGHAPAALQQIESHAGLLSLAWKPIGAPPA